jgi:hypothetical protein
MGFAARPIVMITKCSLDHNNKVNSMQLWLVAMVVHQHKLKLKATSARMLMKRKNHGREPCPLFPYH